MGAITPSAATSNMKGPTFSSGSNNAIIHGKKTTSTSNLFNNISQNPLKVNTSTQINGTIKVSKLSVLEQLNQILLRHALTLLECYALSDLGMLLYLIFY